MQTNIAGDRLRGALGEAGAQARREPLQRVASRSGPRPIPPPARNTRSVFTAGAGGSPCSLCGKHRALRGRAAPCGVAVAAAGPARPPAPRAAARHRRGRGGSRPLTFHPSPPARRFLCCPTTFLPTIPRAGRACAALEIPATPPFPIPPPPLPGKTRERRRLGERPAPGREGGTCGVPVAVAVTAG